MNGIVLSRRDFREADQIISILTAEEGKREYVARGVKKIVSKNTSQLEPTTLVSFGMAEGKQEFAYLTNVQPVETFHQLRTSQQKLHLVGYALDALDRMLRERQHDVDIYHFFISYLRFLNEQPQVRLLLLDAFMLKLFAELGFLPVLSECVVCEKSFKQIGSELLASGKHPGVYFAGGGVVCADCREEKQKIGETVLTCGLQEISTIDVLLRSDWVDVLDYRLEKAEYKNVHKIVYEFVLYHSERTWEDWGKFMK